jgi:hypothetical protein
MSSTISVTGTVIEASGGSGSVSTEPGTERPGAASTSKARPPAGWTPSRAAAR